MYGGFIAFVLGLCFWFLALNEIDPDLWGHVLYGRMHLALGSLMRTEPLSWTATGHVWINHELLAEVIMGLAHSMAGGTGIFLLKFTVGVLALAAAILMASARMASHRFFVWFVVGLGVQDYAFGLAARPQIFSLLGMVCLLYLMRSLAAGRWWAVALLPVLSCGWINTHGGVLLGLVLLLVAAVVSWIQRGGQRWVLAARYLDPVDSAQAMRWTMGAVLYGAGMLVNPYGLELPVWLVESVRYTRPQITEWNPMSLNESRILFFAMALLYLPAFFFSGNQKRKLWEFALGFVLCVAALRHERHVSLFALYSMATLPGYLAAVFDSYHGRFGSILYGLRFQAVQWSVGLVGVVLAMGLAYQTLTQNRGAVLEILVPRNEYPVQAVEFINGRGLGGNLLVFFDWGQMALWEMPQCAVSFDGRLDTCYPRDLIEDHWKLYWDDSENLELQMLDIEKADLALLPTNTFGASRLARHEAWRVIYSDSLATVLVNLRSNRVDQAPNPVVIGDESALQGFECFPDQLELERILARAKKALDRTS